MGVANLDLRGYPPSGACFDTATTTLSTSTCPTRPRWAVLWWHPCPDGDRPVTVYTEHSMWDKVAVLVKLLNRATVRRDRALIAVSQAAHDALPPSLRPRAQVVVHGVDLDRVNRAWSHAGTSSGPRFAMSWPSPTATSWP